MNLQNISTRNNQDFKNQVKISGEEWTTGEKKKTVIAINKHK